MPASRGDIGRFERRERWLRFVRLPGFAFVVCLGALLLFFWPLVASGLAWSPRSMFNYYFAVWAALILVILLISLATRSGSSGPGGD